MALDIHLDGSPQTHWMGHYLAETGCIWIAPTEEEAVSRAPDEISGFYKWLRRHGEELGARQHIAGAAFRAVDVQHIENFGKSGAAVGFFKPDREPATDAGIATAIRRLGYARRDLIEAVIGLSDAALDWQPPGGKRTLRANLHHVRNCHGWYLTRVLGWSAVEALMPEPWPQETFSSLEWTIRRAVDALLELPNSLRAGTFQAERPDEEWSARKMLRRFVEHEREHVEVVRRTVQAWRESCGQT
jgi:hypothetical protein